MKSHRILLLCAALLASCARGNDYTSLIDTRIGTGRTHSFSYGRPGGREYNELGYVPYPEPNKERCTSKEAAPYSLSLRQIKQNK